MLDTLLMGALADLAKQSERLIRIVGSVVFNKMSKILIFIVK